MKRTACMVGVLILCGSYWAVASSAQLRLVERGRTSYKIYHAANAPTSVRTAAQELRDYLKRATGAELPIVNVPSRPMICLGVNDASQKAGLSAAKLPMASSLTAVRGGDLYILGVDTADGARTPGGGFSTGTLYGVYEFIRDVLGVRWLMPGPHGDDVPRRTTVAVPAEDRLRVPVFQRRKFVNIGDLRKPAIKRWVTRHGMGSSFQLSHGHAWHRAIPGELFKEHPDYFAMYKGERMDPVKGPSERVRAADPRLARRLAGLAAYHRYKLCTTNPDLVRAYAAKIIDTFDKKPETVSYSLSPTDSRDFCKCPRCLALYERDPLGRRSVSALILKFYNDVGELVAKRYPDRRLGGYFYSSFLYPPTDKSLRPRPNVFLVGALNNYYGVGGFRPKVREDWVTIMAGWASRTRQLCYYGMPGVVEDDHPRGAAIGAPNPPCLAIQKFLFSRLKQYGVTAAWLSGVDGWGRGGALNYIVVNLIRDPGLDPGALLDEYCDRAFGKGGPPMNALYRLLDRDMETHARKWPRARYVLTPSMLKEVYAANYGQIEALFLRAWNAVETPAQKYRLDMFRKNLALLNWCLRRRGLIDDNPASPVRLSDEAVRKICENAKSDMAVQWMRKRPWKQLLKDIPKRKRAAFKGEVVKLPERWRFRVDPKDVGVREGWFRPQTDDSAWGRIRTVGFWEDQGYGAPKWPGKGGYNGYAWYRADKVVVPRKHRTRKASIHFGAVDESCWVYVNGKLAAAFKYDEVKNPDSWEQPLELPLGDSIHYGKPNTIAVRVHDSGGAGGLWKGAELRFQGKR